jgi:hypothetical protein
MPAGFDKESLVLKKVSPDNYQDAPVRLFGPLLDVDYMVNGQALSFPASLTYVYFNLSVTERLAWDQGLASIYYRDLNSGAWVNCASTTLVSGSNSSHGRLSCIAPQLTLFGVGVRTLPADQTPGAAIENGVLNAEYTENTAYWGSQGVYAPNGLDTQRIAVRIVDAHLGTLPAMPFEVRRSLIKLEWVADSIAEYQAQFQPAVAQDEEAAASGSSAPVFPPTITYVFYRLDRVEQLAWNNDTLSIYFYDLSSNSWQICPTVQLSAGTEDASPRVACIASQLTYYALGIED